MLAGETPIPCVACNQTVKFARSSGDGARSRRRRAGDRPLYRAVAAANGAHRALLPRRPTLDRDQSYFLFATTQAQLDFLRFPLGDLTKAETRADRRRAWA